MLRAFFAALILATIAPAAAQEKAAVERVLPESAEQLRLSYSPVVKKTAPAVVNIYTQRTIQAAASPFGNDPFFRRFFGGFGLPRDRVQRSLGSGVIVAADGIVVTNNHVVGEADLIRVVLADRREFEAEVLLADERTDLAVLRIDAGDEALPTLSFGDSDGLEVGDLVLAIGNPFGVGQTVTSGIVSALARTGVGVTDYQFFIQTDAAINPGNSGGALIDLTGNLIGVNTAIYSRTGGSNGVGFAIPANMVRAVVAAAQGGGKIVRPYLGIEGQAVSTDIAQSLGLPRPVGVLVDEVYPGSAAAQAGVRSGDVVTAVKGREVLDPAGLRYRVATEPLGAEVPLTVLRDGRTREIVLNLTPPPENPPRRITVIDGETTLSGLTIANLSPAFAEEIGLKPDARGVVVVSVAPGSFASRLRVFRRGDIIEVMNGVTVTRVSDMTALVDADPPVELAFRLRRGGRPVACRFRPPRSLSCRS